MNRRGLPASSATAGKPDRGRPRGAVGPRWATILALGWLLLAGCSYGNGPATVVTPEVATTIPSPAAAEAPPPPTVDMDQRPLIWFSPAPPRPQGSDLPLPEGSQDFNQLFVEDSPWGQAAEHLDIFKIHSWAVRHSLSDGEWVRMFEDLNRRGIPFALEMEPFEVPDPSECEPTESFEGTYDLEMAQRIKDLGGTIAVVAIDEPYANAHKWDGPGSCQRPVEQVAEETAEFVRRLRQILPDVVVGSIEVLWSDPQIDADEMAIWLDAYEAAAVEPFGFLHMDNQWDRSDWPQVMLEVEAVAAEGEVPVGIIYFGEREADSDLLWLQLAAEKMATYEQNWGGTPDRVVFQSWHDHPHRVLPDSDLAAFTGLINRYFALRTVVHLDQPGIAASGALTLAGELRSTEGEAVPEAARSALILVRVNVEGAGPGQADLAIHHVA